MIGLSTQTHDLNGFVILHDINYSSSDLETRNRRVTRTATLDTGAYLDDRGYSDGDRTITVSFKADVDMYDRLAYLLENYSTLWISLRDGCYIGSLSRLQKGRSGYYSMTILLQGEA